MTTTEGKKLLERVGEILAREALRQAQEHVAHRPAETTGFMSPRELDAWFKT